VGDGGNLADFAGASGGGDDAVSEGGKEGGEG